MTTNPTVDKETISEDIVRNLMAIELQAYADDGTTTLEDPKASDRGSGDAPFVMTSYPTATTALYPHVIVREASFTSAPFGRPSTVWEADMVVDFDIEATTDTEKFKIKDGVRAFVIDSEDDEFRDAGFQEASIDSTSPTGWDETSETRGMSVSVSGIVYIER